MRRYEWRSCIVKGVSLRGRRIQGLKLLASDETKVSSAEVSSMRRVK